MKCFSCDFNNLTPGVYCQKCGVKLNLTHDEIAASMHEKASREAATNLEYQIRQLMVLAICLFLVTLTAHLFFSERPRSFAIPASSFRSEYVRIQYDVAPEREFEQLPWDTK